MPFTPEEIEAMRAADEEIERTFCLTQDDIAEARSTDRAARLEMLDNRARKIAENQRAYYAANREKIAENQRAYYAANREKLNAYQRAYRARKKAEKEGRTA